MRQVYGAQCLSRAQIFRWYSRFKTGVETITDEARSGRQISVRNDELIAKVRERIHEDRCLTVRMMADEFDVNRETIRKIIVEDLDYVQCPYCSSRFNLQEAEQHMNFCKDKQSRFPREKPNSKAAIKQNVSTSCQAPKPKVKSSPVSPAAIVPAACGRGKVDVLSSEVEMK